MKTDPARAESEQPRETARATSSTDWLAVGALITRRDAARRLAEHDLIKALANYDAVVMGQGTILRAYNELSDAEHEGYGWMLATVRQHIWGS